MVEQPWNLVKPLVLWPSQDVGNLAPGSGAGCGARSDGHPKMASWSSPRHPEAFGGPRYRCRPQTAI